VDEITLFEELRPPLPPDALRIREAARARLTAATGVPSVRPAWRRRSPVMAAAAAAALVAGGASYGLTASPGASRPLPGDRSRVPATAAGLTAVHGCPGMYITAGTLEQVHGTQAVIQPANDTDRVSRAWQAQPVAVATGSATAITLPASGTVSDITNGAHVLVQGTWAGGTLVATEVDVEAALPSPGSFGPHPSGHVPTLRRGGLLGPPIANGTVTGASDGSFAVIVTSPLLGTHRIQVSTSNSTKVLARTSASLSQLAIGANVVAVGQIARDGVLTASTVAQTSGVRMLLAGGPVKIRTSSCSASAITTAAVLAGAEP
jgi:Domain of unknown function (DUF5666)